MQSDGRSPGSQVNDGRRSSRLPSDHRWRRLAACSCEGSHGLGFAAFTVFPFDPEGNHHRDGTGARRWARARHRWSYLFIAPRGCYDCERGRASCQPRSLVLWNRALRVEAGASPARSRHCNRSSSAESQTLSATKHRLKRGRELPEEDWFMNTATHFAPPTAVAAIPLARCSSVGHLRGAYLFARRLFRRRRRGRHLDHQGHVRARIRARQPPSARLPLPLTASADARPRSPYAPRQGF